MAFTPFCILYYTICLRPRATSFHDESQNHSSGPIFLSFWPDPSPGLWLLHTSIWKRFNCLGLAAIVLKKKSKISLRIRYRITLLILFPGQHRSIFVVAIDNLRDCFWRKYFWCLALDRYHWPGIAVNQPTCHFTFTENKEKKRIKRNLREWKCFLFPLGTGSLFSNEPNNFIIYPLTVDLQPQQRWPKQLMINTDAQTKMDWGARIWNTTCKDTRPWLVCDVKSQKRQNLCDVLCSSFSEDWVHVRLKRLIKGHWSLLITSIIRYHLISINYGGIISGGKWKFQRSPSKFCLYVRMCPSKL